MSARRAIARVPAARPVREFLAIEEGEATLCLINTASWPRAGKRTLQAA
jgi:hypothetical protein